MVSATGSGQRSYDYQATGGQQRQAFADQMTQSALDQIALHRAAHRLAHDETRTRRGSVPPWHMRVPDVATQMDHQQRSTRPASTANRFSEVLAPPQPILGGQHSMRPMTIRRTDGRGPCHDASRESRVRRGCAYADGSRGSSHDGGCSAGRCACSLGGSREIVSGGASPGCHRAPTKELADQSGAPLDDHPETSGRPSPIGRQAAAAIDNSTSIRYARLGHSVKPGGRGPGICTHPVDNDLNRAYPLTTVAELRTLPACLQDHIFAGVVCTCTTKRRESVPCG